MWKVSPVVQLKVKKIFRFSVAALLTAALLSGCLGKSGESGSAGESSQVTPAAESSVAAPEESQTAEPAGSETNEDAMIGSDLVPLASDDNYRTTYEVFVYSFADASEGPLAGDGIGDLAGLIEKLDYINDGVPERTDDLGCDSIWLMPIFPSPTYHKYDATDYCSIDPVYGTMTDFEGLIGACHERGMTVILDLALNHTSTEHRWFQKALEYMRTLQPFEDIDTSVEPCYSYYNFRNTPADGFAKLNLTDSNDPNREWYYEARFWEGMPDLNLDNDNVRAEIRDIVSFWLDKGVDGFRLDAVTSYYTDEKMKSIDFLDWFNDTVKEIKPDAYLVGEAWAARETYADYYGSGVDSFFDFAFSGADGIIAQVVKGSRGADYFASSLAEEEALYASKNENFVNAPFYTNHDMARSAGYYAYDDGTKTKFAEGLNLMMGGNAFIYYGEELGMKGSGKDENKRAPMFWTAEESGDNTSFMTAGPPGMDKVAMKFPAADEQAEDPSSILSYVKQAVRIRSAFPAIKKGRTVVDETLTSGSLAVFSREAEGCDKVFIFINSGEEPCEVPVEGYGALAAELVTGDMHAAVTDNVLTLPAYGIAVMK